MTKQINMQNVSVRIKSQTIENGRVMFLQKRRKLSVNLS